MMEVAYTMLVGDSFDGVDGVSVTVIVLLSGDVVGV
jgi:hypothetical protein